LLVPLALIGRAGVAVVGAGSATGLLEVEGQAGVVPVHTFAIVAIIRSAAGRQDVPVGWN